MKPLVIYHKGCRDGFTAAWVARKRFPDADFHPALHGDEPPNVRGRTVYILDFAYPREVLERMHREAASLLVLDHHKTAEEDLRGLDYATFDMNRSGAGLAWDYFFPGEPRPWLVNYVEDRDLWRFKLRYSREANAVVGVTPLTFEAWDALDRHPNLVREGAAILRHEAALVSQIVKNAKSIQRHGLSAALVNTPVLLSESLAELAKEHAFAVGWFEQPDGGRIFSLRSEQGRGADVGAIAKAFGGGGHKHAAGVRLGAERSPLDFGSIEVVGAMLRKLAAMRDEGVSDG